MLTTASLDIETYGMCERDGLGRPLPKQTVFHPQRSLQTDGVHPSSIILTTSLTLVKPPPSFTGVWDLQSLAAMEPGDTVVFDMSSPRDRRWLLLWLRRLSTALGMNLPYDFSYLNLDPAFRTTLSRLSIIDLSIVNYLEDEFRSEKSLKTLGPVLQTHIYKDIEHDEDGDRARYPHPGHPDHIFYNASDTHNTILAIAELARRIIRRYGKDTAKLSPACLAFYNKTFWSLLAMQEAGVPLSRSRLERLETRLVTRCERIEAAFKDRLDFPLSGKGSKLAKENLIPALVDELQEMHGTDTWFPPLNCPSLLDSPLLKKTPKKALPSTDKVNRKLFLALFPKRSDRYWMLKFWQRHTTHSKLTTSYLCPLLRHKSGKPHIQKARMLPLAPSPFLNPDTEIAYSTIYPVPTSSKDDTGDEGGQRQGRLAWRNPAAQTFPRIIKKYGFQSRFRGGAVISYDLAQIELRVAGILSGEPTLLDAFMQGLDLHTERAISDFGPDVVNRPNFSRNWRQPAKHANFTDLNLGGPSVLQSTILKLSGIIIPFDVCKSITDNRHNARPVLYRWQMQYIDEAARKGFAELPLTGQSHAFIHGLDGNKPNEIVNFPIQCWAANINLAIQHELHRIISTRRWGGPAPVLFLNVYDALCIDCPPAVLPLIDDIYEEAITNVRNGLWRFICEHYGHYVALEYDRDTYT